MMKKMIWLSAVVVLVTAVEACHDNKRAKNFQEKTLVDDKALQFFRFADESDLAEIKTATVAENNSKNPRVINFAKMMIKDHTDNRTQLKKLMFDKLVTVPDTISIEHKTMMDSLSKKTGPNFDKAYVQMMVKDHQRAIEMYKPAQQNTLKKLVDFAGTTIPKLQMHLDSAKAIAASLK